MNLADLTKLLAPLRTRIANMVSRATVQLVDDAKKLQLVQVNLLDTETRGDVERFQSYGFTSVPKAGAEAVVIFVGGRRDHGLCVGVDDRRYRLTGLQPGEVAVYTDQGDSIVIHRGGTIQVTAATKVVVNAPDVELAGNTDVVMNGTAYRVAEDVMLASLSAALAAVALAIDTVAHVTANGPAAGTALTAAVAGITAFQTSAAAYLSTKVKHG